MPNANAEDSVCLAAVLLFDKDSKVLKLLMAHPSLRWVFLTWDRRSKWKICPFLGSSHNHSWTRSIYKYYVWPREGIKGQNSICYVIFQVSQVTLLSFFKNLQLSLLNLNCQSVSKACLNIQLSIAVSYVLFCTILYYYYYYHKYPSM